MFRLGDGDREAQLQILVTDCHTFANKLSQRVARLSPACFCCVLYLILHQDYPDFKQQARLPITRGTVELVEAGGGGNVIAVNTEA